jgi:predicted molibdopterin-dependent oxidoreductase YjgC
MVIATDSDRVRHSRKLVFELLASSVDLSLVDEATQRWMEVYGVEPNRFGPPAPGRPVHSRAGHHEPPDGASAATVAQPVKIEDELYIRDYARCILCYKCVAACGEDAQNTFAIAVGGRGFDAMITTEFDDALPDSACVYCGNCIGVCPTGALMPKTEFDLRASGDWDEDRQTVTRTICPYCGVGCNLELHVQDNRVVKVTSPLDHSVTSGHLCIKGRFGFQHLHPET